MKSSCALPPTYYNRAREWGTEATIATKRDAYLAGSVRDYERGRATGISERFWQCDTSIAHNSWGYIDGLVLRNAGELIRELVDCVSKNGGYLLNIAPQALARFPRINNCASCRWANGCVSMARPSWFTPVDPLWRRSHRELPSGDRGIVNGMLKVYAAQDMRFTIQPGDNGSYTL